MKLYQYNNNYEILFIICYYKYVILSCIAYKNIAKYLFSNKYRIIEEFESMEKNI